MLNVEKNKLWTKLTTKEKRQTTTELIESGQDHGGQADMDIKSKEKVKEKEKARALKEKEKESQTGNPVMEKEEDPKAEDVASKEEEKAVVLVAVLEKT